MTCRDHSWSWRPALVNRFAQCQIIKLIRANIPHGSKACHQSGTRILDTQNRAKRLEVPYGSVVAGRVSECSSD
jgi:hypothetical protein